jgi:hypothetical protein
MQAEIFPEAKPRIRRCIVDPYAEYLDRRLREGRRSPTCLWRELREQGFRGQENIVRYWLLRRRGHRRQAPAVPPQRPALRASPRHIVWLMLKGTASAKRYLDELYRASPVVSTLAQVGREFSASSGIVTSPLSLSGLLRQRRLPWSASQIAWQEISRPSKQR